MVSQFTNKRQCKTICKGLHTTSFNTGTTLPHVLRSFLHPHLPIKCVPNNVKMVDHITLLLTTGKLILRAHTKFRKNQREKKIIFVASFHLAVLEDQPATCYGSLLRLLPATPELFTSCHSRTAFSDCFCLFRTSFRRFFDTNISLL